MTAAERGAWDRPLKVQIKLGNRRKPQVLINGVDIARHVCRDGVSVDVSDPTDPRVLLSLCPGELDVEVDDLELVRRHVTEGDPA